MPVELLILLLAAGWYWVMIFTAAYGNFQTYSLKYLAGPRDGVEDKSVLRQRGSRACANMAENLIIFAIIILVAVITENTSDLTRLGAIVFLVSRVLYAPAYWFGWPIRALTWFSGVIGTLMIVWEIFF